MNKYHVPCHRSSSKGRSWRTASSRSWRPFSPASTQAGTSQGDRREPKRLFSRDLKRRRSDVCPSGRYDHFSFPYGQHWTLASQRQRQRRFFASQRPGRPLTGAEVTAAAGNPQIGLPRQLRGRGLRVPTRSPWFSVVNTSFF